MLDIYYTIWCCTADTEAVRPDWSNIGLTQVIRAYVRKQCSVRGSSIFPNTLHWFSPFDFIINHHRFTTEYNWPTACMTMAGNSFYFHPFKINFILIILSAGLVSQVYLSPIYQQECLHDQVSQQFELLPWWLHMTTVYIDSFDSLMLFCNINASTHYIY